MSEVDSNDVAIEDVREILAALCLGTHARPYSAHEVVQREVLPALRRFERVGRWHRQATFGDYCASDGDDWPCRTRRVLDGEP